MTLRRRHKSLAHALLHTLTNKDTLHMLLRGVHGVYVHSSIMDEGGSIKTISIRHPLPTTTLIHGFQCHFQSQMVLE